jgi:hypothetical protein
MTMPKGQLYINGFDAFVKWGISLNQDGLSALMTPAPNKGYITNDSRLEHGVRHVDKPSTVKVNERQVNITFNLTASTEEQFFARYAAFCTEVLEPGVLNIRTSFQPTVLYRCKYESCTQFAQFMRGIAHYSLRLTEPNPKNRSI